MGENGFISLSILEELRSYFSGVMELEGVKELSILEELRELWS